ncbi:YciI family protein [Cognatiyoonia sp. IB215446]|uniref:YciI family protein n=1 Tax=Cognatiyoonia sp. IB215446 TaxID=3097355 RepID=UPI002A111284|nr:YciI family protein [Cognatiyoonia sp. IB215446]MDX8349318.1 YciI family protein [Cognatiyoonia sp. IB215446]
MRFALMTKDKPGALQTRMDNRAAHLDYVAETGVVEVAGPFLDDDGQMCGSLIVLEVPDMAAAEAWAANDPYAKAGLFEEVTLRAWKKVVG